MIETARRAAALGFKTVVMQSGEDMYYTQEKMCRIIEAIKKFDVAVTLSVGERSYGDYKAFREAGADRYLMRIETTDKDLYHRLDPGMSWQHRYECLLMIKELGYELGSGIMVGLPGQTIESIADDLLFLQNQMFPDKCIPHRAVRRTGVPGGDSSEKNGRLHRFWWNHRSNHILQTDTCAHHHTTADRMKNRSSRLWRTPFHPMQCRFGLPN